jgi:hypothetical protein
MEKRRNIGEEKKEWKNIRKDEERGLERKKRRMETVKGTGWRRKEVKEEKGDWRRGQNM